MINDIYNSGTDFNNWQDLNSICIRNKYYVSIGVDLKTKKNFVQVEYKNIIYKDSMLFPSKKEKDMYRRYRCMLYSIVKKNNLKKIKYNEDN